MDVSQGPKGPVTKLKNLSEVHSMLLGVVGNDFQLDIQKESYGIESEFKTFREKISVLIGKNDFRELAKMCICRMYTIDLR